MKTQHTPGPWILEQDTVFIGETRKVQPVLYHGDSEGMANARLIASGPDLLSALAEIVDHAQRYGAAPYSAVKMFDRARAAIAKAKGGEQC